MEDQLLVLRRSLAARTEALREAEDRRDAALGSEARDQAEQRIRAIEQEIAELETETQRLERREDADYDRWREHAHRRRYSPPEITRILDIDFVLE